MRHSVVFLVAFAAVVTLKVGPACSEVVPLTEMVQQQAEAMAALTQDNTRLKDQVRLLESRPVLTREALVEKSLERLRQIAADARQQRQTVKDFEGFVTWMTANLSGYARYVEAGSVAAGFARILPIPYAGQASVLTKFVSQGALSLNAASVAIAKYLDSSQQFIARVERLEKATGPRDGEIAALTWFANEQLLNDLEEVQQKLATTAEISSSSQAFLESLNHYVGSSDELWNKTKSLLKKGEGEKKEKGFLSESIGSLKNRAAAFTAKLRVFGEGVRKDGPLIKSLTVYDELLRELAAANSLAVAPPPVAAVIQAAPPR